MAAARRPSQRWGQLDKAVRDRWASEAKDEDLSRKQARERYNRGTWAAFDQAYDRVRVLFGSSRKRSAVNQQRNLRLAGPRGWAAISNATDDRIAEWARLQRPEDGGPSWLWVRSPWWDGWLNVLWYSP